MPASRGGRSRLLFAYAALGLLAIAAYLLVELPVGRAVIYESISASAVLAILVGVWLHKPAHPLPWALIGAGLLLFFAGDVTWDVYSLALGTDPYPSLADVFYLSGYPFLAAGVVVLARRRIRDRTQGYASLLDAAIVTVAAAVVSWVFLIGPQVTDESVSLGLRALSAAYPLSDLLLLALLAQLLLGPGTRSASFWFLAFGFACNVTGDTVFGFAELTGLTTGRWVEVVWLLASLSFGAAALHPSMTRLLETAQKREDLTRLRLAALAAAAVTAPTVLALQAASGELTGLPVIVAGAALLPLLALVRMSGLLWELRRAGAERERLLVSERVARAEAETAERLLVEQNDRLRELDRLKDEFVALVSHELRTPLTSITGYLELVLDDADELSDDHRQFLGVVERNSRRLLRVVGDLLFVAQIEAGTVALEYDEVDLDALAAECVEGLSPAAEAKGVELRLDARPVPPMQGDRARIAQLLDNLVSNAIKFTPAGGRVVLALTTRERDAVFAVSDTGIGVPKAEQHHVFERFFRSSTAQESAIHGTGLGLAITRAIVEAHAGSIGFTSREGHGTTFRVHLPLEAPASVESAAAGLRGKAVV